MVSCDRIRPSFLHNIEEDLRIFGPEIEGFSLWPVVRSRAWQLISGVCPDPFGGSIFKRLVRCPGESLRIPFAILSYMLRKQLKHERSECFFFSNEAYRSVRRDDGWWDVYFDDVATHPRVIDRVTRCETRSATLPLHPTVCRRNLFTDEQLMDQVVGGLVCRDSEAVKQANLLCDMFLERTSSAGHPLSSPEAESFRSFCIQRAKMFRRSIRWYTRLFKAISPKVVAILDAYNWHGVVAAAIRSGLRVVEFQHGVIDTGHPGYNWSSKALAVREKLAIPSQIATYGDYWSNMLSNSNFWDESRVVSTGSARMDWVRRNVDADAGRSSRHRIIYTSQHPTRRAAIALWHAFIEQASHENLDYSLVVKVHRMEQHALEEYRALEKLSPNVEVLSAREGDTLSLIRGSDVHVSGWSTCHFESLGLGVPTIAVEFGDTDMMEDHRTIADIRRVSDVGRLLGEIREIGRQSFEVSASVVESLFKSDAVENAVRLLIDDRSNQ